MTCSQFLHFESDYIENDYMRTYECTIIKEVDLLNKRFVLNEGVSLYHPVDDIYKEVRHIRRVDETIRVLSPMVIAQGNVFKGSGKYTSRLAVYIDPWAIQPDKNTAVLKITGEQISNIGTSGVDLMDFTLQQVPIAAEYAPPDTEIIVLEVTAPITPQDQLDIATAVWSYTE